MVANNRETGSKKGPGKRAQKIEMASTTNGNSTMSASGPRDLTALLAHFNRRMFPSGHTIAEMLATTRFIITQAEPDQVVPGESDSMTMMLPGVGVLTVNFDGRGGVELDPTSTTLSKPMAELAAVLKWILGEKFTVGAEEVAG